MSMNIPFFERLTTAQNILISGAGGGFDIYTGLPLYFSLQAYGKNVYLANYSFAKLEETDAKIIFPGCLKITPETKMPSNNYFPEKHLATWLANQGQNIPLYAFEPTGVQPLKNGYEHLIKQHNLDTIILVDGGTDSLMHGDEEELGTPIEDSTSLAAVHQVNVPHKYLTCIGFGIDGISHSQFLENVAALTNKGFLGTANLSLDMPEVKKFVQAVDDANSQMPGNESIICNSIVSALEGHFGKYHRIPRTKKSNLQITPLMSLYWCFELEAVAKQLQYYELMRETETHDQVGQKIAKYRMEMTKFRAPLKIPLW